MMALDPLDQADGGEAALVVEPLEEAAAWPGSDPVPVDERGDAGCLPFDLYAPGWEAVWGRAVRDAEPR